MLKRLGTHVYNYGEDESFESLVDLFTLISISLILAALVYGLKSSATLNTARVPIKEIVTQVGTSDISYEQLMLLYITRKGSQDRLIITDSEKGKRGGQVTRASLGKILDGEFTYLNNAREIALIVNKNSEADSTMALFGDVQDWMERMGMNSKLTVGFVRK